MRHPLQGKLSVGTNSRPPRPERGALTGLRYIPEEGVCVGLPD